MNDPSTAFALGGRDLVADALPRNFPFELCEGQQDVDREVAIEVVVLNCWVTAAGQSCLAPLCQSPAGFYQPPLQAGQRPSSDPRRQHQRL